jgi:hypothetical protein
MVDMKRSFVVSPCAIVALFVLAPAAASADVIELGRTPISPLIAPVCPPGVRSTNCTIVLTRSTALATVRDGLGYPTKVTKAGWIVAFTLGLSQLSSNPATERSYIRTLDRAYGGGTCAQVDAPSCQAQAGLTVLAPGRRKYEWKVVAQTPMIHLQQFLGTVAQFPLAPSGSKTYYALPVVPGDVIALTVPTWAPVLTYGQSPKKFAYRQSRMANCSNPAASQQAQLTIGADTQYICDYAGTRVEYSATEVTNPATAKNPIR